MHLIKNSEIYSHGFQDIYNCKKNNKKTNALAVLKILSYFTILIPLGFIIASKIASLYGRAKKKESLTFLDNDVTSQANRLGHFSTTEPSIPNLLVEDSLNLNTQKDEIPNHQNKSLEGLELKSTLAMDSSIENNTLAKIIQNEDSTTVRLYPGDLTPSQKLKIKADFIHDKELKITFQENAVIYCSIRKQDIFDSGAQVIVNAANSHLGGGGGIDGAIHANGGNAYQNAHKELQKFYKSNYTLGYAVMIESGQLKERKKIENVIVVAGPQGESTKEKENALYSCYYNSLLLAHHQNKTTIAFPSISTGIFGFPQDKAASISIRAIHDFIAMYSNTSLKSISIHFLPNQEQICLDTYKTAVYV